MSAPDEHAIAPEVVLPCRDLDHALAFFTEHLGFRLESIFPADDPRVARISGHGVRIRLQRDHAAPRLGGDSRLPIDPPALRPSFVLTRAAADATWSVGRAGMRYRDLVPDRQGGRFVASHIRIPDGGPVPDMVHFHEIRFQMIYCRRGWVRVVYEDQGPPFVLREGDCVLQPPRIRHRVLESSPGLEVIEIGCPAEHETRIDHALALPTAALHAERDFGGQRFVRHQATAASSQERDGFAVRDLGIAEATAGLASARVLRRSGGSLPPPSQHDGELLLRFVLAGSVTLQCDGHGEHRLGPDDCVVVPKGARHALVDCDDTLELLEVSLPA